MHFCGRWQAPSETGRAKPQADPPTHRERALWVAAWAALVFPQRCTLRPGRTPASLLPTRYPGKLRQTASAPHDDGAAGGEVGAGALLDQLLHSLLELVQ